MKNHKNLSKKTTVKNHSNIFWMFGVFAIPEHYQLTEFLKFKFSDNVYNYTIFAFF